MGSSQSTAANPEQSLEERKLQLQEKKFEYQQQADRASAKLKEREIQLAEAQSEAQKTTQKIYSGKFGVLYASEFCIS